MSESKKYNTILIDPPWPEQGGGKIKRGADRHYPLLSVADIPRVIAYECPLFRPADNAHLYLWATDNYLPSAISIMKLLEFRYIRTLPWIKLVNDAFNSFSSEDIETMRLSMVRPAPVDFFRSHLKIGIGQYFRGCSELLLFGVRGKGKDPDVCTDRKNIDNIIIGPRSKHSKKPDSSYEKIEARSQGPYLEIFARSQRPGWDSWGNEI